MIDTIEQSNAGIDLRLGRPRGAVVEAADRTWSDGRRLILALVIGALVVGAAVWLAGRSAILTHSELHAARLVNDRLRARQEALLERMSELRGQLQALEAETAPARVVEDREEVNLEQR